jgi:nucleoside-diphosphate-sugar epimerase
MRILITGGAGYLGSVLSLRLVDAGHHVRVLDNLTHGSRGLLPLLGHPRFTFVNGDIRRAGDVASALADVQAVVHLAAIVGDPACARDPDLAREVNEVAADRLLAEAERAAVLRFVFASTCSNYGRMADTSIAATETHELRPVSLYAETKVAVERKVLAGGSSPLCGTVLRFATLFGPSDSI